MCVSFVSVSKTEKTLDSESVFLEPSISGQLCTKSRTQPNR